jgi:hypothetical protein
LLRVLQEREVGWEESRPRKIGVQCWRPTPTSEEAAKGSFRSICLPHSGGPDQLAAPAPRVKISVAGSFFCSIFRGERKAGDRSHDALRLLADYHWPGEMFAEIEAPLSSAVIRCRGR